MSSVKYSKDVVQIDDRRTSFLDIRRSASPAGIQITARGDIELSYPMLRGLIKHLEVWCNECEKE